VRERDAWRGAARSPGKGGQALEDGGWEEKDEAADKKGTLKGQAAAAGTRKRKTRTWTRLRVAQMVFIQAHGAHAAIEPVSMMCFRLRSYRGRNVLSPVLLHKS